MIRIGEAFNSVGATQGHRSTRPPDADWVILADPEGNRVCVVDISWSHHAGADRG